MKNLLATGVKFKSVIGEVFTYKLYFADTDITGHHLEKCPRVVLVLLHSVLLVLLRILRFEVLTLVVLKI